jgi:hypothetical protein
MATPDEHFSRYGALRAGLLQHLAYEVAVTKRRLLVSPCESAVPRARCRRRSVLGGVDHFRRCVVTTFQRRISFTRRPVALPSRRVTGEVPRSGRGFDRMMRPSIHWTRLTSDADRRSEHFVRSRAFATETQARTVTVHSAG